MGDFTLTVSTGRYNLTGNPIGMDLSDVPIGCTGEWISIDDAMALLEAPVDDTDFVQGLIDDITALFNSYLGRNLLECVHTDTFFRPRADYLELQNYPVHEIYSIRKSGARVGVGPFDIDYWLGQIFKGCYAQNFNPCNDSYTVNYKAGYTEPPREVTSVFRGILGDYYAAGGSATGGVGPIKKVSLTGVAMVEFQSSGITYSGVDQQLGVPEALKNYVGILDKYKSNRTMGVAL